MVYLVVPRGGSIRFIERQIEYFESVPEALGQAATYLAMGFDGTSIETEDGKYIDGSTLASCCQGEMSLRYDLTVVSPP